MTAAGRILDMLAVVVQMALRNLIASRWKTWIVAGIIASGAGLVVIGGAVVDALDHAVRRSITGSIAGHLQLYSAASNDALDVLGGLSPPDLAPVPDFGVLASLVRAVPNVADVVPMGIAVGMVNSGNSLDQATSRLRRTLMQREREPDSPALAAQYRVQRAHLEQVVGALARDLTNLTRLETESPTAADDRALVARAQSSAFWRDFEAAPLDNLEFLENRVAPLAQDSDALLLRYVGTDPAAFQRAFERMRIVDGRAIPVGERGFLFSKYVYEEQIKLKVARGLDKIARARRAGRAIANDPELQRLVRENRGGVRELMLQLDALELADFRRKLQPELHTQEPAVEKLLAAFLDTGDDVFDVRYRFFYQALAPSLELYRIAIGDSLVIRSVSRSGYVRSANLKVFGTYTFKGLERSPQAGTLNMLDLVSFRELSGFVTPEQEAEVAALRASLGVRQVARNDVETALFGEEARKSATVASAGTPPHDSSDALARLAGASARETQARYDPQQLQHGPILNAAVVIDDESDLAATLTSVRAAVARAGLPLKVVSWHEAAGLLGQFATLMRAVLYGSVLVIFLVALVVINNALVMATLHRVREIGTLRAIGAQRTVILAMLALEAAVVGLGAGGAGALAGAAVVVGLRTTGIPALSDALEFVFAGPRLYPELGLWPIAIALVSVLAVALISSAYPAFLALRVSAREAMAAEE